MREDSNNQLNRFDLSELWSIKTNNLKKDWRLYCRIGVVGRVHLLKRCRLSSKNKSIGQEVNLI